MEIAQIEDGWVSLPGPDGVGVHARLRAQGRRVAITDLYVHGAAITAQIVRLIPMRQIEALANSPSLPRESHGHESGRVLVGPLVALTARSAGDVSLSELRERAQRVKAAAAKKRARRRKPLRRPDGTNPERFYQQVAAAYSEAVLATSKPAKVLAEEAGVPVGTVHRWIREARRRGYLPPARQGRAG